MSVFDHAMQKADPWIRDMMRELGTDDPHRAYHALSAAQKAGDGHGLDPERVVAATFEVLRRHVSPGELASLARVLPPSLAELAR